MKTKTLERQCRDLGELIAQLQDTHSEIKVAIIKGDLSTASMHAHELADDMACFAKDDAIQMAKAIDSYQDDAIRDDLLIHAIDIVGELENPNSDHYADDPSMRRLANDAKRLAVNLDDIASDLEAEFEG